MPSSALVDHPRRRRAARYLAVGLAAVAPYLLLAPHPFVFDAPWAIVENRAVQSGSLRGILTSDFFGSPADAPYSNLSYRPLVSLTYALEVRLFGNAPWAFHAVDVLLHAAASIAVLALLEALGLGSGLGIAAAVLFAVHPVATETVCSVVGRADLMAGLALLVALLCRLAARERRRRRLFDAGALAALAVALLSKEYAVSFPFALVAFDLLIPPGGEEGKRAAWRASGRFWVASAGLLAAYVALRWAVLRSVAQSPAFTPTDNPLQGTSLAIRWSTAVWILAHAARLLVLPFGLSHHYAAGSLTLADGPLDPRAVLPTAVLAAAAVAAIWGRARHGSVAPAAALVLFAFPLLPSLNTVGITGVLFAERWLYLPTAGLALVAGWLLARLPSGGAWRPAAGAAAAILLVGLAGMTAVRAGVWSSERTLAESALRSYPRTAKVWVELGLALGRDGQDADAADAFRRSIDLDPRNPAAYRNLATALDRLGRHREAADAWRRLIALAPKDLAVLWSGLGESALLAGETDEAVRALERAHGIAPADASIRARLAEAHVRAGRPEDALRALVSDPLERASGAVLGGPLREVLLRLARSSPPAGAAAESEAGLVRRAVGSGWLDAEGLFACGLVASRLGDPRDARDWLDRALAADPDILRRRHESALRLETEGKLADAADTYREILTARPDHAPTLFNLGRVLLASSRPDEAAQAFRRGLAIQEDPRARALLAEALRRRTRGAD